MATITNILDIFHASPLDRQLLGYSIDRPSVGQSLDTHTLEITGWVLAAQGSITYIELIHGVAHGEDESLLFQEIYRSRSVYRAPVGLARPDVAEHYPTVPGAAACGFSIFTSVLGLPAVADVWLIALFEDGSRASLGFIRVQHQALHSYFHPRLQPVMLNGLGRSGTTLLMHLLASHPSIVAQRIYPYETHAAAYWMHTMRVLSMPADHRASAHPDTFLHNLWWTGYHPYQSAPFTDGAATRSWFQQRYPEQLAAFTQQMIEGFYASVAQDQGQLRPRYFIEKFYPDRLNYVPWLIHEIYPQAREIFLVRDFRDTVSSMLAFNAKRNQQDFGRAFVNTDEEFVWLIRLEALRLLRTWQSRASMSLLVHYEDLVRDPATTMRSICVYLDLPIGDAELSALLHQAQATDLAPDQHRTSASAQDSIGQWATALSPSLRQICAEAFDDIHAIFGYV
jgi:hypothetical protein